MRIAFCLHGITGLFACCFRATGHWIVESLNHLIFGLFRYWIIESLGQSVNRSVLNRLGNSSTRNIIILNIIIIVSFNQ